MEQRDNLYTKVCEQLDPYDITDITQMKQLDKREHKLVRAYYRDYIRPVLSPQVIDERHPSPIWKARSST